MDYKLSNGVIANIIQLLQLSMMTGTDISDQFRNISLRPSDLVEGKLDLSPEYAQSHEDMISGLTKEAEVLSEKLQKEEAAKAPAAGFVN